MAYNPPELRQEIRDTLVCMAIPFEYERVNTDKGHTWVFNLDIGKIVISGYNRIKLGKKSFKSAYDLKRELMTVYNHLI